MIIVGVLSVILLFALPIGIIYLVRRGSRGATSEIADTVGMDMVDQSPVGTHVSPAWDRALIYTLSFAGLIAVLVAVSGLLGLAGLVFPQLRDLVNSTDAKNQAGIYLATLIVATPIWLGLWQLAQRRLDRVGAERNAMERRLFLAATFAVTAIVGLFSLRDVLEVLLTLPGASDQASSAKDAFIAGARLLTFGVAWLAYARLGWRERKSDAADFAHDLAVYSLAGFGLVFLSVGVGDAVRNLVFALQGTTADSLVPFSANAPWSVWGEVASWLLAGGVVWGAIWWYDMARGGRRLLRVAYLYIVLLAGAYTALAAGIATLGEMVRRMFGYESVPNNWDFLHESLPVLVAAGAIWAYHWTVVRRQATLFGAVESPRGKILWPRRLFIALLSLGGIVTATVGIAGAVWTGIDALLTTHDAVLGGDWWRDQLSWSITAFVVGSLLWLPAWWLLRRAGAVDPEHERVAPERRWLLGGIVLASALAALGFGIAALFQIISVLLQTTSDNTLSDTLRYLSVAVIAVGIGAYYGLLLRADERLRGPKRARTHVFALLVPGAEATLAEITRTSNQHIELMGYLRPDQVSPMAEPSTLEEQLLTLGDEGAPARALLVLRADGGQLIAYSRERGVLPRRVGAPMEERDVVITEKVGADRVS